MKKERALERETEFVLLQIKESEGGKDRELGPTVISEKLFNEIWQFEESDSSTNAHSTIEIQMINPFIHNILASYRALKGSQKKKKKQITYPPLHVLVQITTHLIIHGNSPLTLNPTQKIKHTYQKYPLAIKTITLLT